MKRAIIAVVTLSTAVVTGVLVGVFKRECCKDPAILSNRGLTYCDNCKTIL